MAQDQTNPTATGLPPVDGPALPPIKPRAKAAPLPMPDIKVSPEAGAPTMDDVEMLNLKIAELREKRTPFGRRQQKLAYGKRPGYHRHWFADHPGRIEEAQAAGYEHVTDQGKIVQLLVGKHKDGRAMIGYLMEIPEILHQEDRAAQQRGDDLTEAQIKRGIPKGSDGRTAKEEGNFYVPQTGISVQRKPVA